MVQETFREFKIIKIIRYCREKMVDFNILIENATIVDGTGNKSYEDSGNQNDEVVTVVAIIGDADKRINAERLTAIPGLKDALVQFTMLL